VADSERSSDVDQCNGCNLIVKLGRHSRDEDAAKTK
jgi:hypothetical protein